MSRTNKLFCLAAIAVVAASADQVFSQQAPSGRTTHQTMASELRPESNSSRRSQVQSGQAKRMALEEQARHAGRVQAGSSAQRTSYVPRHLRSQDSVQPVPDGEVIDTPSPRGDFGGTYMESSPVGSGCSDCGTGSAEVGGDWFDGGCSDCGCPPGDACDCPRPRCWIDCVGGLFRNTEMFFGAQAFQGYGLQNGGDFGFHGGFNTGVPLNWLTCGLFSFQIGVDATFTNLASETGDAISEQLFYTAGVFRRVDYGLQGGVVADVLDASSDFDPRVVQIRGELSWAYPSQAVFGFRFAQNVQDHDDAVLDDVRVQSLDNYRFFFRQPGCHGGYSELELGSTDEGNALVASKFDIPFTPCWALRSGFTYVIPDASDRDGWNIFLGMSFRPRGNSWYDFYHRPLFDVADNGTLMLAE